MVIAEIGINHEGSVYACAMMIEAAARAGVDAVKLQSADPDEHYLPGTDSHALYSKAVLSWNETAEMFALARTLGVEVLTTCGDERTLDFVEALNPAAHKISSGMLGHLPMIRRFAATGRTLLFSSGMAETPDIDTAIETARSKGAQHIAVMQCASLYPAAIEDINLRVMKAFSERYRIPVGLSDHTLGIEAALLAVAAGACVVEKHFSLDNSRPGFDHGISLEPSEMRSLVQSVRRIDAILGDGQKALTDQEARVRSKYMRKLVARVDIPAGKAITELDLAIMRTPTENLGIPSTEFDNVVGRLAIRPIGRHQVLTIDDLS